MRLVPILACTIALTVVAACQRGEQAPPPPANEVGDAAPAVAPVDPAEAVALMRERHDRYEEIGRAMKGIGDELKARSPSMETIRRHADLIGRYAPQVVTWFPPGTGPEAGRTRAKAEIWSDFETFRERARAFEAQAARFGEVAQGEDLDAIRAAQRELGQACRDCHDRFRGPEIDR